MPGTTLLSSLLLLGFHQDPLTNLYGSDVLVAHFTEKQTEAQRCEEILPIGLKQEAAELEPDSRTF